MRITQLGEQIGAEIVDVDVRGLDEDGHLLAVRRDDLRDAGLGRRAEVGAWALHARLGREEEPVPAVREAEAQPDAQRPGPQHARARRSAQRGRPGRQAGRQPSHGPR